MYGKDYTGTYANANGTGMSHWCDSIRETLDKVLCALSDKADTK